MRIAAVGFMNAWPLTVGLPWAVTPLLPAAMTRAHLRDCDLVLAPVIAVAGDPAWELLPEAPAIGCRGAVQSVRLDIAAGHDVTTLRHVALSPESQTSNMLAQVLLTGRWQRPNGSVHYATALPNADATVIIGDRALMTPPPPQSIDLGAAWYEWTGLPFVFAAWFRRSGAALVSGLEAQLCAVRDHNLADLDPLLRAQGLAPDGYRDYLTRRLHYGFGPTEQAGLAHFLTLAARLL
ncbi:MAG: hypothetical protein HY696_06035 [Deltaproteobacteria bacterium]|nr:hypothetical protein [Deltaproteobacteria bacterium]